MSQQPKQSVLNSILIFFILIVFNFNGIGQLPDGSKTPILWEHENAVQFSESHLLRLLAEQNESQFELPSWFNFHPRIEFNSGIEPLNYDLTKPIKRVTVFAVFDSHLPGDILQIEGNNTNITMTDSSILNKSEIIFEKVVGPKFISYTGKIGKKASTFVEGASIVLNPLTEHRCEGGIAELIVYDQILSRKKRRRVESYLSMKYGISLRDTSEYLSSTGEILFNPSKNKLYKHNITAIGRDDGNGLFQKQSQNSECEIDLTLAISKITPLNSDNSGMLNNNEYFFWSDNGQDLVFDYVKNNLDQKLCNRKWQLKSINTNLDSKEINFEINTQLIQDIDPAANLSLLVSQREIFQNIDEDVIILDMKKNGDKFTVSDVKLPKYFYDKAYFTFVQKASLENEMNHSSEQLVHSVFPNPVREGKEFTIKFKENIKELVSIHIRDSQGKLILDKVIDPAKLESYNHIIYVAGTYFISIQSGNLIRSFSLVVQ